MLRRLIPALFVVGMIVTSAVPAKAQWASGWFHNMCADWKRNNMWPEPFIYPDRESVCLPLATQAMKGWQRQNLLGSVHFDPATNVLNSAGENKIRYILTQNSPDRRAIFVERGFTGDVTAARVDAVQQAAVNILPVGELPEVADTNMILEGQPAAEVNDVMVAYEKSMPPPRLPAAADDSSSAGTTP